MLAVLAIAGVLSIIALVGFTYAMNKHKANETVMDVMLRGTNVPMIDENYATKDPGHEFRFPGMPSSGKKGTYYEMVTLKSRDSAYFVEAADVSEAVCKMILKMNPTDIDQIIVDGTVYLGDESICDDGAAMQFCFGDDLCEDVDCGANGEFVDGRCQCVNDFTGLYCEKAPQCNTTEDCDGVRVCSSDKQCICPEEDRELNECREDGQISGCNLIVNKEDGTQCADGVCSKGECGCLTIEEIGCSDGNVPVLSSNGCAYACADPDNCPSGTQLLSSAYTGDDVDIQDEVAGKEVISMCVSVSSGGGDGSHGNGGGGSGGGGSGGAGGYNNMFECVKNNCYWFSNFSGEGLDEGLCCCSAGESQECCEAFGYGWCNGGCNCAKGVACINDSYCEGSKGKLCMASYNRPVGVKGSDCKVENYTNPTGKTESDCHITAYKNPTGIRKAPCMVTGYTNPVSPSGKVTKENEVNLSPLTMMTVDGMQGCAADEYCDIRYEDEGCSTEISSNAGKAVMYGVCTKRDRNNYLCPLPVELGTLTATDCKDGYYCDIRYTDKGCTTELTSNKGSEVMYGVCTKREQVNRLCPLTVALGTLTATECKDGYYCDVRFTDETCSTQITSNKGNAVMYGVCTKREKVDASCPWLVELTPADIATRSSFSPLGPWRTCTDGEYCDLQYIDKFYKETPSADHDSAMYGYCLSTQNDCEGGTTVGDFCISKDDGTDLNWWSAAIWCRSQGKQLASMYDICPDWNGTTGSGKCLNSAFQTAKITISAWTSTTNGTSKAFVLKKTGSGTVSVAGRNEKQGAVCK